MKSHNTVPVRAVSRHEDLSQLDAEDLAQARAAEERTRFLQRRRRREIRRLVEVARQDVLDLMVLKDCNDDMLDEPRIFVKAVELAARAREIADRTKAAYEASVPAAKKKTA